jgi:hypothetical protein
MPEGICLADILPRTIPQESSLPNGTPLDESASHELSVMSRTSAPKHGSRKCGSSVVSSRCASLRADGQIIQNSMQATDIPSTLPRTNIFKTGLSPKSRGSSFITKRKTQPKPRASTVRRRPMAPSSGAQPVCQSCTGSSMCMECVRVFSLSLRKRNSRSDSG